MTSDAFKRSLRAHQEKGFFKNLRILRGIERESLRVTQEGKISQNSHPRNLGSPLTSEDITTDFAEALVELVTPALESAEELFAHLSLLHKFLYSEMEEEILWNFSMPCAFQSEQEIKIAEYGNTNSGMLKHIYRKGLRLRYGSIMQCVSGIHFNFSLSEDSWNTLAKSPNQSFINQKYLGAIRNIKRNFWFLLERLGASPIAHESYLLNREHSLSKHGNNDLFLPFATSLRMSDVGYQSSMQNALKINYNNLDEFIDAIVKGINTPVKDFEEIGLVDEQGVPQQISTGILQIENELYDTVRPKRSGPSGSRPATLLKNEGIEYLELRGIDINPFIPEGIDENQIKLLDIFIMHSLISESPQVSDKEIEEIRANQKIMVENGRSANIQLQQNGVSIPLKELKKIFHDELEQVAIAMDEYSQGYSNALSAEMSKNLLPSEKIMNEMNSQNLSFQEYGLVQSKKIAAKQHSLAGDDFSRFSLNAKKSLKDFENLNKNAGMDINKYVELYNSKNLGKTMKALQCVELAGPEKLIMSDIDDPVPGNGEVLIEIKAASVNFPDVLMIQGLYQVQPPMPFIPGAECSGVIAEIGEGVDSCNVGDHVFVMAGNGCFAEKIVVEATRVVLIPKEMDFPVAAALPMTYGTSLYALKQRANLKSGETLLVLGAAGGVGLSAVELGKAMGARVIAAASSEEKIKICLEHGADEAFVYPSGNLDRDQQKELSNKIKELTGGQGANVIYDPVGGSFSEPALRSIAWEGRFLVIGFAAGEIPKLPLNLALLKGCQIVGVFWGAWTMMFPDENEKNFKELFDLHAAGKINPEISDRFTLEESAAAIAHLKDRKAKGKVIIDV